jgi:predicted MFS family arabinose efflux permease
MSNQILAPVTPAPRGKLPSVLRYPKFTVLWISETVSLIGDRILLIALISLIYQQTQSAASVGLLSMIKAVPALVLGTFAGVFVDRWSHKWTMVIANLLQVGLVLLIPLTKSLPVIFIVYLGMSMINQFFFPARSATIPELIPEETLLSANSLFAIGMVSSIIIGPALGGWIMDVYGLDLAFYVDALTFLVPAIAVGCLALPQTKRAFAPLALTGEWREGLKLVHRSADLRSALLLSGTAIMQIASLSVLGIVLLDRQPGVGAAGLGALMSSVGIGMLVGAIIQNFLKRYFSHKQLAAIGTTVTGLSIIVLPWLTSLLLCLACTLMLGLGLATVQANVQTILQSAPEQMRGRVLSMGQAISGSVTFLAAALVGLLSQQVGIRGTFMISGLVAIVAGTLIISRRSLCLSR